jgi:hypothetical protein
MKPLKIFAQAVMGMRFLQTFEAIPPIRLHPQLAPVLLAQRAHPDRHVVGQRLLGVHRVGEDGRVVGGVGVHAVLQHLPDLPVRQAW